MSARILLAVALLLAAWRVDGRWKALTAADDGHESAASLSAAMRLDPTYPTFPFRLALLIRDAAESPDPGSAIPLLEEAVRLNPWSWRYRYELGRAYELAGRMDDAAASLESALAINDQSALYRQYLASFLLRQHRVPEALEHFRIAMAADPTLWPSTLDELLPIASWNDLRATRPAGAAAALVLMRAACRQSSDADEVVVSLAAELFEEMLRAREPRSLDEAKSYPDCAARRRRFAEARKAWADLMAARGLDDKEYRAGVNLVWNGGFERELEEGGLGWRRRAIPGAKIELVQDGCFAGRCARLRFDRSDNPTTLLGLSQTIVYEVGAASRAHELRFRLKTEGFSGGHGPYLELLDSTTGKSLAHSDVAQSETPWSAYAVPFELPSDGGRLQLQLSRQKSPGRDTVLRGTVWLDEVQVHALEPHPEKR